MRRPNSPCKDDQALQRYTKQNNETHSDDRKETRLDCTHNVLEGLGTIDHSHGGQESYSSTRIGSTWNEGIKWVIQRTSGLDRCNEQVARQQLCQPVFETDFASKGFLQEADQEMA